MRVPLRKLHLRREAEAAGQWFLDASRKHEWLDYDLHQAMGFMLQAMINCRNDIVDGCGRGPSARRGEDCTSIEVKRHDIHVRVANVPYNKLQSRVLAQLHDVRESESLESTQIMKHDWILRMAIRPSTLTGGPHGRGADMVDDKRDECTHLSAEGRYEGRVRNASVDFCTDSPASNPTSIQKRDEQLLDIVV